MGDLRWTQRRKRFVYPLRALRYHAVALGGSGSGKTETLFRIAYGGRTVYNLQVIFLDAKGETKREEEQAEDNAARFVATMHAAGANSVKVFPSLYYNGWQGKPIDLKNRLLSVIDFSESAYYGDVAANVVDLALQAPKTPRRSDDFLANFRLEHLKAIYANQPDQLRRVLSLDKNLIKQVEMRYRVFFQAMNGQLDGTLDYANTDAVYLRVHGFTLRDQAPRLGRFLIYDFMHYIAERRQPGTLTLLIIDEFNALRLREETSILFEQARSFGGCLVISAQGYAGLGPPEYANRILDACSTYILHACSDPLQVSKRAGKRLRLDTSWSEDEDEEGTVRKSIRPHWDWKVPENAVMQQEMGQAYWIYHGRAQQVQSARVPITKDQVREGWKEIQRQEEQQRQLLELEALRRQDQKSANTAGNTANGNHQSTKQAPAGKKSRQTIQPSAPAAAPQQTPPIPPLPAPTFPPAPDDDEPDRL